MILDDKNLLILGGTGGPNNQFSDCWLLNMEGVVWKWTQIIIEGKENAPSNISSNPGCKVSSIIHNIFTHFIKSSYIVFLFTRIFCTLNFMPVLFWLMEYLNLGRQ